MPNLTFFGGTNMIGGNQFILQDNDLKILLDFGIPFKTMGVYFEEFLKPRVTAGLEDYLKTGLIPHLPGLYREDLINIHRSIRDNDEILPIHNKPEYDLLLLSHAHVDHCGFIPLLDHRLPVVCSKLSKAIMKVMSITGLSGLGNDYFECKIRDLDGNIPKIKADKIVLERTIYDFIPNLNNPWSDRISSYDVDHSIPGATSYIIKTSEGLIIYTGDFRAHGMHKVSTYKFIEEIERRKKYGEKVLALLIEGTTIGRGANTYPAEEDVYEALLDTFKSHPENLIIVDFGPRNIERLLHTLKAAKEVDRKVLLTLKDAYLLKETNAVAPYIPNPSHPDLAVYKERKGSSPQKWEKEILEEYEDKLYNAFDVRSNPQDYILLFSFFDINELIDVNLEGGIYIYSSSEAFTEEQNIDLKRLGKWLELFNFKFIGDPSIKNESQLAYHVSGHAYPHTLKEVVERIEPEFLIPIHSEKAEIFKNLVPHQKIIIPAYGETISIK